MKVRPSIPVDGWCCWYRAGRQIFLSVYCSEFYRRDFGWVWSRQGFSWMWTSADLKSKCCHCSHPAGCVAKFWNGWYPKNHALKTRDDLSLWLNFCEAVKVKTNKKQSILSRPPTQPKLVQETQTAVNSVSESGGWPCQEAQILQMCSSSWQRAGDLQIQHLSRWLLNAL